MLFLKWREAIPPHLRYRLRIDIPRHPADLTVGVAGVAIATDAGDRFEKKIDLPPTWVRGFLQVQSAGTLPSISFSLSASTVAEILMILGREREKQSPRALKYLVGH